IKAAVSALWNTQGLNWPSSFEQQRQRTGDLDMLDWLKAMFGFQALLQDQKSTFVEALNFNYGKPYDQTKLITPPSRSPAPVSAPAPARVEKESNFRGKNTSFLA
ncbi:hypothetical protein S83_062967, partial [Arachis hypogaea]